MRYYLITILFLILKISVAQKLPLPCSNTKSSTYGCVRADLQGGILLDPLPLDKSVVVYGINPSKSYSSGCLSIWEILKEPYNPNDLCHLKEVDNDCKNCRFTGKVRFYKKVYSVPFTTNDSLFYAVVNKYFRANTTYKIKFEFEKTISEPIKKVVTNQVLNYYNNLDETLLDNGSIKFSELEKLREALISALPKDALQFVKKGSIIDEFPSSKISIANSTFDRTYLNIITNRKDLIDEIYTKAAYIDSKLQNFISSTNFENDTKHLENTVIESLKKINSQAELRKTTGSGQIKIPNATKSSALETNIINDDLIKTYLDNLNSNKIIMEAIFRKNNILDIKIVIDEMIVNENNLKNLKKNNDELSKLQDLLLNQVFLSIKTNFDLSTDTDTDFETTGKLYVGADIGALTTKLIGNRNDSWRVIPYLGMNLYIVPVNKEASLIKLFNEYGGKALLKITSLHFGITIPKLDATNYQGVFVGDSNRGGIAGIGIRPYQAVRISSGWLFINRSNGTNFSSSSRISGRPYFSVSLDWDLRKLIPTVANLFK